MILIALCLVVIVCINPRGGGTFAKDDYASDHCTYQIIKESSPAPESHSEE